MHMCHRADTEKAVALRKESVDRNTICLSFFEKCIVALRKESVDRNIIVTMIQTGSVRRSPQGERG